MILGNFESKSAETLLTQALSVRHSEEQIVLLLAGDHCLEPHLPFECFFLEVVHLEQDIDLVSNLEIFPPLFILVVHFVQPGVINVHVTQVKVGLRFEEQVDDVAVELLGVCVSFLKTRDEFLSKSIEDLIDALEGKSYLLSVKSLVICEEEVDVFEEFSEVFLLHAELTRFFIMDDVFCH